MCAATNDPARHADKGACPPDTSSAPGSVGAAGDRGGREGVERSRGGRWEGWVGGWWVVGRDRHQRKQEEHMCEERLWSSEILLNGNFSRDDV